MIYLLRDCPGVEVYVWRETDDWAQIYRIIEWQLVEGEISRSAAEGKRM